MSKPLFFIYCLLSSAFCLLPSALGSPPLAPPPMNAAEIQLALNKLRNAGRVLYVAAHPDDENTALISYLANGGLFDTAYLSLTRGDGGQNLIGPELREGLGVIRTQELLAARRIDHGRQFFTRANDFGFSKSSGETLRIWDRDKVLADIVWTIRRFRPDIVVTRFSAEDANTHGHHSASAQLAGEAFGLSGDPAKYPEQLKYVKPWSAHRLVWNTARFFYAESKTPFNGDELIREDVGGFEPFSGLLFPEIAARSRSMHKSQGFGVGADLNARREYFKPLDGGSFNPTSHLVDIMPNVSWQYKLGEDKAYLKVYEVIRDYRAADPAASVPGLLEARRLLAPKLVEGSDPLVAQKLDETDRLIAACLGLHLAATTPDAAAHPGETLPIQVEAMYRSALPPKPADEPGRMIDPWDRRPDVPVKLVSLRLPATGEMLPVDAALPGGRNLVRKINPALPAALPYSQPYWLREPATAGTYTVADQQLIGLPGNPPAFPVEATLDIGGETITYTLDTRRRKVDPVAGEVTEPLVVAPPVFVELPRPVFVFGSAEAKSFGVRVEASTEDVDARLSLEVPDGWQVEPAAAPLRLRGAGSAATVSFKLTPPADPKLNEGTLRAVLTAADGQRTPAYGRQNIRYPHIDPQTLIPRAEAKVVRADIRSTARLVGYVPGAGDAIPESLREIGAEVKVLSYDDLHAEALARCDAVVFGVRAYNVQPARFTAAMGELRAYAEAGGVVIVQYNTLPAPGEGGSLPFGLHVTHDRVTDEAAAVTILVPEHPLLTVPNRISSGDFDGWVQERGLYFPDKWDAAWTPLLSCRDPGEPPRDGGLLAARCGRGYFVYTGYAWFRQLPAGVPGAYRLFANMISLGKPKSASRKLVFDE